MQRKRQPVRRKTSRKERSLIKPLSICFLLIVLCVGAYWNQNSSTTSVQLADEKISHVDDGKVSGRDIDYSDAAKEVQDAVDTWLRSQDASVSALDTVDRETARQATGGKIRWKTTRAQVVPKKEFSRQDLEKQLEKSQGKVILYRSGKDTLAGEEVMRYDIALSEKPDQDSLSLVAYTLYVTKPGTSPMLIDKVHTILSKIKPDIVQKNPAVVEDKQSDNTVKQSQPTQIKGRLAIVIDDFGARQDVLSQFNAIPVPLTYAVMPYKSYTQTCANSGYNAGRQIIVHMPMQPLNVNSSESIYISMDMGDSKIRSTASDMVDQVPHAIGVNNHQGSADTADKRIMQSVLSVLRERKLFFLDSRTNSHSVGEQTALSMGVGTAANDLFIDNDADVNSVKSRLRQAGKMAVNNGSCIVIGHARPNTAEAVRDMVDELHGDGVDIVFVSQFME